MGSNMQHEDYNLELNTVAQKCAEKCYQYYYNSGFIFGITVKSNLSLQTPPLYGHLSITDGSLGPKVTKNHSIHTSKYGHLYNADT